MNYQKKILKYKTKYLLLKNKINQVGGTQIPYGALVEVNIQNGSMDGMSLQCMWISILQYLQQYHPNKRDYENLTIEVLRSMAGLEDNTKHHAFDDTNGVFNQALRFTADLYGLHIHFYDGKRYENNLSIVYNKINEIPHYSEENIRWERDYPNEVNIISYGMHFELIRPHERGSDYQIFLPIEERFYDMTNTTERIKQKYKEYDKLRSELLPLKKQIEQERIDKLNKMPIIWGEKERSKAQKEYTQERDEKLADINRSLSNIEEELKQMILHQDSDKLAPSMLSKVTGAITGAYNYVRGDSSSTHTSPTGSTLQKPTPTSSSTPTRVTLQKPTPTSSSKLTENTHKEFKPEPQKTKEEWKELFKKAFGPK